MHDGHIFYVYEDQDRAVPAHRRVPERLEGPGIRKTGASLLGIRRIRGLSKGSF